MIIITCDDPTCVSCRRIVDKAHEHEDCKCCGTMEDEKVFSQSGLEKVKDLIDKLDSLMKRIP